MRVHLIDRRGVAARLVAVSAVVVLAASCSGTDPEQVEASQASPEPTIEPPPSSEPTEEPSETEPEEPEATIGEDEPLYAPLPELTPDPENDVPDDIEQLILDAYADAYNTEFTAYATGELDEDALSETHAMSAYDDVVYAIEEMAASNVVEWSGDSIVDAVIIRDFAGGSAVIRECFTIGPATGDYDVDTGSLSVAAEVGQFARDWLIELVSIGDADAPHYRVVEAARTNETAGCEGR